MSKRQTEEKQAKLKGKQCQNSLSCLQGATSEKQKQAHRLQMAHIQ